MRNRVWLSFTLCCVAGCRDGHGWRRAFLDYARPDTVERLHAVLDGEIARGDTARRRNRELTEQNAYLVGQVTALARIVNDIDRDLGGGGGSILPLRPNGELEDTLAEREELEAKRQRIATNLSRLRAELRTSDSLFHAVAASDSSTRATLASTAENLAMFRTLAENRAVQFAEFQQRIDSLQITNREIADQRNRIRDSLSRLAARMSRVYYVVGTREELLAAGVIREVTVAKKSWRGWQREHQLMPSSEAELSHLIEIRSAFGSLAETAALGDESEVEQQGSARAPENGVFRELDRYHDLDVTIPSPRRGTLRVLSPQDLRYAEGVDRGGRVDPGSRRLHITDPDGFWESGRYLILLLER